MPSVKRMLVRSPAFMEAYREWTGEEEHSLLIGRLRQACLDESGHINASNLAVQRVVARGTEGFLFSLHDGPVDARTGRFLLDHLQNNVKMSGYVSHHSDIRRRAQDDFVETIERHFLKPRFSFDEEQHMLDQKYGNVTIEYSERDDIPYDLKFYTHTHNDRRYSDPLPFDELVNHVLV